MHLLKTKAIKAYLRKKHIYENKQKRKKSWEKAELNERSYFSL